MAFCSNGIEFLSNGESYFFSPKHRGIGNPNASVWLKNISFQIEHQIAYIAINNNMYVEQQKQPVAYNLYKANNKICAIGYNVKRKDLIIAKFVNSSPNTWHGYPGDYIGKMQDKPNQTTLKQLVLNGVISKKEMSRISRGQPL